MLKTLGKSEKLVSTNFNGGNIVSARNVLLTFFTLILLLSALFFSQSVLAVDATIKSVRVGLTPNYTRITLESNQPLQYELSMLDNPHRVIVDLSNTKLSPALAALPEKVDAIDPFVQKVRIGQFKPDVIRLVFDLKANVVPRTFVIAPKDNFAHRLILDIYHPDKATKTDLKANINPGISADLKTDILDELVATLIQDGKQQNANRAQHNRPYPKPQINPANQVNQVKQPTSFQAAKNRKPVMVPRVIIVAIDPGHGGKDPGAVGYQGTHEKDVTLAIARKLKERIDKESNMRAVLTRDGDYYISLPQRRINARRANADLFVSIHADANPKSHAHGSSVFTLSEHGATSTTAS
ncbi:MAG: N-acetylmuramoyl-L-alanine amidase, partial [Nitrosomonas sp.]|nr:N-acetylmuramoyl-L-alanine amidase [Nitrosomonas sp.]